MSEARPDRPYLVEQKGSADLDFDSTGDHLSAMHEVGYSPSLAIDKYSSWVCPTKLG